MKKYKNIKKIILLIFVIFNLSGCSVTEESGQGVKSIPSDSEENSSLEENTTSSNNDNNDVATPYFIVDEEDKNLTFSNIGEQKKLDFTLMNPPETQEIYFSAYQTEHIDINQSSFSINQSLSQQISYEVNITALENSGSGRILIFLNNDESISTYFDYFVEINSTQTDSSQVNNSDDTQTNTDESSIITFTNISISSITLDLNESQTIEFNISNSQNLNSETALLTISDSTKITATPIVLYPIAYGENDYSYSFTVTADESNSSENIKIIATQTDNTSIQKYLYITVNEANTTDEVTDEEIDDVMPSITFGTTIENPIVLEQSATKTITVYLEDNADSTETLTIETENLGFIDTTATVHDNSYYSSASQKSYFYITFNALETNSTEEQNETVKIYLTSDNTIYYDLNFTVNGIEIDEVNETQNIETVTSDETNATISLAPDVTLPVYFIPEQEKSLYIILNDFSKIGSEYSLLATSSDSSIVSINDTNLSLVSSLTSDSDKKYYLLNLTALEQGNSNITVYLDLNNSISLSFNAIVQEENLFSSINAECNFNIDSNEYSVIQSYLENSVSYSEIELISHLIGDTIDATTVSIFYEKLDSYSEITNSKTYYLKDSNNNLIASLRYASELENTKFYLKYTNIYDELICLDNNYFPTLEEESSSFTEGSVTEPDEIPDPTS
jgi:hypothetical protein